MTSLKILKNIDYKSDSSPQNQLDLYLPLELAPLVVYIHGGGWENGSKSEYEDIGTKLSNSILAVAIINYKLSNPSNSVVHPQHILDVANSLKFLINNENNYNYDNKKLILCGHSAGALMTSLILIKGSCYDPLRLIDIECHIKGYILVEGIYNLVSLVYQYPSYVSFVSKAFSNDKSLWIDASPAFYSLSQVKGKVLLVQGKQDELLDFKQTDEFITKLKASCFPFVFNDSLNGSHFGIVHTDEFLNLIINFIKTIE